MKQTANWIAGAVLLVAQLAGAEPTRAPADEIDQIVSIKIPDTAGGARLGLVDLGVAFIFHPAMADFVVEEQNFSRPVEAKDLTSRMGVLSQRFEQQKQAYKKYQELKDHGYELNRQWGIRRSNAFNMIQTRQAELRRTWQDYHKQGQSPTEEMNRKYSESIKAMEEQYWKEVKSVEEAQKKYEQELSALTETITSLSMLPREDLVKRTEEILRDLGEAVAKAQERYGLTLVINKAFTGLRGTADLTRVNKFDQFPGDLSLYRNQYWEYLRLQPGQQPAGASSDPMVASGKVDFAQELLGQWYGRINESSRFYQASSFNQLVIAGGHDVTSFVVAYILLKHSVPIPKIKSIAQFVTRVGSEPFVPGSNRFFQHADR